jgi:demethylmenaquinone methyltransferase/2-methoxy-6-polyprenyl-1,4-benzoquinol methylase
LKPGGTFLFLELSTPEQSPVKELYTFYSKHVMPVMARLFTSNEKEYAYLPNSVALFPQGREMMAILSKNGFRAIRLRRFTLGIATMYLAEK